jgi:hypothetical protein
VQLYQQAARPETLFGHIFGESEGYLVTFSGQQARLTNPDAPPNQLVATGQKSFPYPQQAAQAAAHLLAESARDRDAYVAVHLFREPGNRLASNAVPLVRCLWLDEDDGHYPEIGPQPTAVVASSASRRHLYWQLTQEVSVEWAVAMNRRIGTWAEGDVGKAGLASVLRVPGTANYKRTPQVDPVTIEITEAGPWEPEVIEQAIPEISSPRRRPPRTEPYDGPHVDLTEFLDGVEVLGEVADGLGRKFAIICPWAHEHSGGDPSGTYVGQRSGGGFWFVCRHAHCYDRNWTDFKIAVLGWTVEVCRPTRNPTNKRTVKITRE